MSTGCLYMYVQILALCQLMPSADNLCKQFGPRSGPTHWNANCELLSDCWALSTGCLYIYMCVQILTLCQLVPSADNLCKQFGPRSGPTHWNANCELWSDCWALSTGCLYMYVQILALCQLEPSADNLCKQFGPRSGPTHWNAYCELWSECWALSTGCQYMCVQILTLC